MKQFAKQFVRLSQRYGTEPVFLAYATTGSHRARAQSALADGARARNRTLRVHGINATCVTAHKPPFPNSRIMLLIFISLSITQFPPEQRVDQDGMIQSHDRSSTSTSTASLSTSTSTSTKNSQNKTMNRSGRSAAPNFRNFFGGHSVLVGVRYRSLSVALRLGGLAVSFGGLLMGAPILKFLMNEFLDSPEGLRPTAFKNPSACAEIQSNPIFPKMIQMPI